MLTEQLTSRQDLVELLDIEPIFDYLVQHGAIDKQQLNGICSESTKSERNKALLQQLEVNSNTAVIGLFINALRQSGQLDLASLLDIDQKIKPTYGSGYLGKQRHKGQVTIEVVLDAVKVPKEDEETEEEEPETEPEISSAQQNTFSQRGLHKSYEDMTLLEGAEGAKSRTWRLREYPYDFDEIDDEDQIRGSFWTMCLPLFCRGKSKKHKHSKPPKNKKKSKKKTNKKCDENLQSENYNEKIKDRRGKVSPIMERTKKFPIESSHSESISGPYISNTFVRYAGDSGEITLTSQSGTRHQTDNNQNTPSLMTEENKVKLKNNLNEVRTKQNGSVTKCVKKKNEPPIIIITKPEEDMTDTDSALPCEDDLDLSDNSETMVWRSDGLVYDGHVEKLFSSLDTNVRDGIVKYFEQDRRSLVLQIQCEQSLDIYNICMSEEQVEQLKGDYHSGKLLKDLEDIFLTQDYIHKMHFLDMKMKVVINEEEFQLAIQDLT